MTTAATTIDIEVTLIMPGVADPIAFPGNVLARQR